MSGLMIEHYWESLKAFVWNAVWAVNLASLSPVHAGAVRSLRVAHVVFRGIAAGDLNMRAASLVYTTLLSVVPVLALAFALFKGFGVHQDLAPALISYLEPLGDRGVEFGNKIIAMVEGVEVGKLGIVGLAVLLYTVVSVMQKVERALNAIWRVRYHRRFFERLSGYLSVAIFGPVFVFAAMFISGSLMNSAVVTELIEISNIGALVTLGGKVVPYLLVVAAFTFVYFYMPNTRVKIGSALFGAFIAGFLWALAGWVFAAVVVGSARYAVIYSSFAILFFFIMWLHVSWMILLMGGSVAFYHQHPEYVALRTDALQLSNRVKERLSLLAYFLIVQSFQYRLEPWTIAALSRRLRVPLEPLEELLAALERASIVMTAGDNAETYVPARDPGTVTIREVLEVVRAAGESHLFSLEYIISDSAVDPIWTALDEAADEALDGRTLGDLAKANPPYGNDGAAPAQSASSLSRVVSAAPAHEQGSEDAAEPSSDAPSRSQSR